MSETANEYRERIEGRNKTHIEEENIPDETYKIGRKPDGTFAAGNCANPNGRPRKGSALTDLMREYLDQEKGTDGQRIKHGQAFIQAVYEKAMLGDPSCMKLIWEYMDGKAVQTVNTNITQENPMIDMLKKMQAEYAQTNTANTNTAASIT